MADRRPDRTPEMQEERKTLTGADIIWKSLEALDVSCVFGYPGGAILPTYDALTRSKVHHVLVRHEQGATHMADGYARASGRVGVAIATSGPGATNMVTGIATAMMDSSPIVCITGQVGSTVIGTDAFQETRHHRHHAADHQTQLSGHARRGNRSEPARSLSHRRIRPSRPGAGGHHQGRAARLLRIRLGSRRAQGAPPRAGFLPRPQRNSTQRSL